MNQTAVDKIRHKKSVLILLILLGITVLHTWSGGTTSNVEQLENKPGLAVPSMELSLFNWVAKILIGSKQIASDYYANEGRKIPESLAWLNSFAPIANYLEPSIQDEGLTQDVLIGKTILAGHEGLRSQYAELRVKAGRESSDYSIDILALVDKVYGQADKKGELTAKYLDSISPTVEAHLGWISKILLVDALKLSNPDAAQIKRDFIYAEAADKALMFGFMFLIGAFLLTIGFFALMIWILKLAFADFKISGINISIPSNQLIDVFILYLIALNILFLYTTNLEAAFETKIKLTAIGTLSLSLLAIYPAIKGSKLNNILRTIGLLPWPGFKNLFVGPIFVAAMWPLFALAIGFYQDLLDKLNIDIARAEHPVVPVFLTSDSEFALSWLFIFAAVVAPIVEEIMFRGVLYSWLRDHHGKIVSIVTSALLFAVVHPQGALGIVPLSLIGCGLAFLREWRGSIIPCMLAHSLVNTAVLTIIFQLR